MVLRGACPEFEVETVRFHACRVAKVDPKVKHGGRRPRRYRIFSPRASANDAVLSLTGLPSAPARRAYRPSRLISRGTAVNVRGISRSSFQKALDLSIAIECTLVPNSP